MGAILQRSAPCVINLTIRSAITTTRSRPAGSNGCCLRSCYGCCSRCRLFSITRRKQMGPVTEAKHEMVLNLLATGHSARAVAEAFGHSDNWIYNMFSTHPEYRMRLDEIKSAMHEKLTDRAVDATSKWRREFDDGIGDAVDALRLAVTGRMEDLKASDRIKASTAWLDRAPSAPKVTTQTASEQVTRLIFEMPAMDGIINAARSVGAQGLLTVIDTECKPVTDCYRPAIPVLEDVIDRYKDVLEEEEAE